jgi:hypothetical protein
VNEGIIVAGDADGVVQQWMWATVVGDSRPAQLAWMRSVCAATSMSTVTDPVPGESFGGTSAVPVKVPVKIMARAGTASASPMRARAMSLLIC